MADEPRFTGTMVEQHLGFLRQAHGPAVVEAALGSLVEADRMELEGALPVSWVRVSALARFYDALAEALGSSVEQVHGVTVDHCTRTTYGTLWRVLLRITTDKAILTRAPIIYRKTYDTGRLSATIDRPGHAVCEITEWAGMPSLVLRGLRIGIANVLVAAGRKRVSSEGAVTPEGARFELTWES